MHRYQLLCGVAGQVTRHKMSHREHFVKDNYLKRPVYPIKLVSTFQSLRLFRDPPSERGHLVALVPRRQFEDSYQHEVKKLKPLPLRLYLDLQLFLGQPAVVLYVHFHQTPAVLLAGP